MRVLVADDDEVVRVFVQRVAEHAGHDVLLAEDGAAALEMVRAEDPDLLITDLRMPGLDGFELVARLRGEPRFEGLPVICLSSVNQRDEVMRMVEVGVAHYVLKPVRPADLAERIRVAAVRHHHWKSQRPAPAAAAADAAQ